VRPEEALVLYAFGFERVGVVVGMDSDHVSLEVAPGTVMKVVRLAVNSRTGPDPLDPDDVPVLGEGDDLDASDPVDGVDLERGGPDQKGARGEDGA
jgi:hypothetical protein